MTVEESTDRIIAGIQDRDAQIDELTAAVAQLQEALGLRRSPEREQRASAPVVEIIEYTRNVEDGPFGVIVPNDVRINGVSILCSDDPVIVNEISTTPNEVVSVTLTVLARRVLIEQRPQPTRDDAAALGLTSDQATALDGAYFPLPAKETP